MNKSLPLILVAVLIIAAVVYYQQNTQTASISLPGGKDISITTHN